MPLFDGRFQGKDRDSATVERKNQIPLEIEHLMREAAYPRVCATGGGASSAATNGRHAQGGGVVPTAEARQGTPGVKRRLLAARES